MQAPKEIKVALAGCGTVGAGVCEIVVNRAEALFARTGLRFRIVGVLVADTAKDRGVPVDKKLFTDDAKALARTDADMLVEVIGGTRTAREVVLAALGRAMPVVTANKALLALHGPEIYAAARRSGACLAFEASCAGGLPIVGPILRGLQANRNQTLIGIFNSTCNFIITEMLERDATFDDAVRMAQQRGYAEADPTLDVSGGDTAHKLTILASLAFGMNVEFHRLAIEGIQSLQAADLRIARRVGYACKLLGVANRTGDALSAAVHPTLVHATHPIAGMAGTSSGILVVGDVVGETFFAGAGAGSLPTASAVVADMIEVATGSAQASFDHLRVYNDLTAPPTYADPADLLSKYYIRVSVADPDSRRGVVADRLKELGLPVTEVHAIPEERAVAAFVGPVTDRAVRAALAGLKDHSDGDQPVAIRVLTQACPQ
jgi:homoserine dehydrogenase